MCCADPTSWVAVAIATRELECTQQPPTHSPGSSHPSCPGRPGLLAHQLTFPRHLPDIDNILNFSELIRHPAPPPRAHGRRRAAPPTAPKTYTRSANPPRRAPRARVAPLAHNGTS